VGNRKSMDERLQVLLANCRRGGPPFALLLADVDHFKWVNDTHGHAAGDVLVAHIGEFLKQCVREKDFVARYGGDEFALMLTDLDSETAIHAADRLRANISQHTFDLGRGAEEVAVAFSIGLACSWREASAKELLERADSALYRAKDSGRNAAFCYWDGNLIPVAQAITLSQSKLVVPPADTAVEASAENASPEIETAASAATATIGAGEPLSMLPVTQEAS